VIRILLSTLKLLLSLASLGVLLTTRGSMGEPSALERIPALMDALEARLAEERTGPAVARPGRLMAPDPSGPARAIPATTEAGDPAMAQAPGRASPGRLAGQDRVKVNRGLP
jgi:hypothetical protein